MHRKRVEFTLSMPYVNSWNGKWSGTERNYTIIRFIKQSRINELNIPTSWRYDFGDGWGACVTACILSVGERAKKSDGFCGYDWMVDSICRHNQIDP